MPNETLQPIPETTIKTPAGNPVDPGGSSGAARPAELPGLEKPGNKSPAAVPGPAKPAGKKRGRPIIHGKYAKQQPASLAGAAPSFVEDNPSPADSTADPAVVSAPAPPALALSRDVAEPYLDLAKELVEMGGSTYQRLKIVKATKNREFAGLVSKKVAMPDGMAGTLKSSLFALCEKHRIDLTKSPEWACGLTLLAYGQMCNESANLAIEKYFANHPEAKPQPAA